MRRRILLAALAVLPVALAVAACSSTVDGTGATASGPSRGESTAASASVALPSASVALPSGSVPVPPGASATPSAASSGSSALDCPAGSITARRAPFCYPLPPGFTDYSDQPGYGTGWTYRTLVSVDVHDLIEVFASHYDDTSRLSDAALRKRFDAVSRLRVGRYGIVRAGAVTATRVAGTRAFRQSGRYASGVETDITTIYLRTTIASIQCQSMAHADQVSTACATVRSTIRLVGA